MLIPVCRNFCSWLRSTPVAEVFALDDPIGFHKVVAFFGILPALVMHLAAHYADFVYVRAIPGHRRCMTGLH